MSPPAIALFVSSHGFGHAARCAAVAQELCIKLPELHCTFFTRVPRWFFEDTLTAPFDYVSCHTDVGLVQTTPMEEDLADTITELSSFLPLSQRRIQSAAAEVRSRGCRLVVSDISPLGVAIAAELGLPCALVENFTWDWIYRAYLEIEPRFGSFISELERIYSSVTMRIQAVPFCSAVVDAVAVAPISRRLREAPGEVRSRLELPARRPLVLVTMGGFPAIYRLLDRLQSFPDITFVIPGSSYTWRREKNLILLPHRTTFQHADLVAAADLVVGKLGYSTLAEVHQAATPYLFLQRRRFPESPVLARFASRQLVSKEIAELELDATDWSAVLEAMRSRYRAPGRSSAGAQQAADLLADLLQH